MRRPGSIHSTMLRPSAARPPGSRARRRAAWLPATGVPERITRPGAMSADSSSIRSTIKPPRLCPRKWARGAPTARQYRVRRATFSAKLRRIEG